jgi:hypothetical protein
MHCFLSSVTIHNLNDTLGAERDGAEWDGIPYLKKNGWHAGFAFNGPTINLCAGMDSDEDEYILTCNYCK